MLDITIRPILEEFLFLNVLLIKTGFKISLIEKINSTTTNPTPRKKNIQKLGLHKSNDKLSTCQLILIKYSCTMALGCY